MKLVLHKTIEFKTFVHEYQNEWSFVREYENNRLVNDFFAKTQDLNRWGKVKKGGTAYFYSPLTPPKKEVGIVKSPSAFKYFDRLYYEGA